MTFPTQSTRESADNYAAEICRAETDKGCFRVIVCHDEMQWIIQRRTRAAKGAHRMQWRAMSYIRTRATLERVWAASTGESAPSQIQSLPTRIMRRDQPDL